MNNFLHQPSLALCVIVVIGFVTGVYDYLGCIDVNLLRDPSRLRAFAVVTYPSRIIEPGYYPARPKLDFRCLE